MNRLASAMSPYLLQHAGNPVDWWQWGEEAFGEARERDVPVLISSLEVEHVGESDQAMPAAG